MPRIRSKKKEKLSLEVYKLRAWKKEFKKDIKDYEEMLARPDDCE